jgi:S-adenosylmethionine:tRNA ribosyltransferase-isomerase
VKVERIADHKMHAERYTVPAETADRIRRARRDGRPILAVGTTVVRTLEAVAAAHGEVIATGGETDIFIREGFRFRVVDQLLTNFHLPGSTLLMLVSAFAGRDNVLAAYRHAVASGYRFFSYGDGMLIR